jgi:hypothetical protein
MKAIMKTLPLMLAASLMLSAGSSLAQSTYGYNAAGTGAVSATANAKVTVNIPKLVLLRVGAAGAAGTAADTLTFNAAPNISSAPGSTMGTDGDNKAATWDGVAPTFADPASQSLSAYGWTNAQGGATLTCATVADAMFSAGNGLTSANINVSNSGTLAHPGATTACGGSTTITKNTLLASTWTYSVLGSALANASAGTHTQTTTYTATTP